jgi:single-strand DNA-binding protein
MSNASINEVRLIGNLGADPEMRYTSAGKPIANLRLATSEYYTDAQGQSHEATEWHRVVLFNRMAEIVEQYAKKGSSIYIAGRLNTRKWTDKKDVERYTTQVIAEKMRLLGGGAKSESSELTAPGSVPSSSPPAGSVTNSTDDSEWEDDIPF